MITFNKEVTESEEINEAAKGKILHKNHDSGSSWYE
jgi:hypothetical protein